MTSGICRKLRCVDNDVEIRIAKHHKLPRGNWLKAPQCGKWCGNQNCPTSPIPPSREFAESSAVGGHAVEILLHTHIHHELLQGTGRKLRCVGNRWGKNVRAHGLFLKTGELEACITSTTPIPPSGPWPPPSRPVATLSLLAKMSSGPDPS